MKKTLLFLLLIIITQFLSVNSILNAQSHFTVRGRVVDQKTNEAIPMANVYLSQTSYGTTTDADGNFIIKNIPNDTYSLVVSIIGYNPSITNIKPKKDSVQYFNIKLAEAVYNFNEVEVLAKEPREWKRRLGEFKKIILGQSIFSDDCVIVNENYIDLREDDTFLYAYIIRPMIIINKALGYKLNCVLKSFKYNKKKQNVVYELYPSFEEIIPSTKDSLSKFLANRKFAYLGSTAHFITSLFAKNFIDQGFQITYMGSYATVEKFEEVINYYPVADQYHFSPNAGFHKRFGETCKGVVVDFWGGGKRLKSKIIVHFFDGARVNPAGYFVNPAEFEISGDMAKEGLANLLPKFWKLDN